MNDDDLLRVRLSDWRVHLRAWGAPAAEDDVVELRRLDLDLPLRSDERRPIVRALHVRLADDTLAFLVRVASELLRDRLLAMRARILQRIPFFLPKKPVELLFDMYGVGTLEIEARLGNGTVELVPRAPLLAGTKLRFNVAAVTDGQIQVTIQEVNVNYIPLKALVNRAAKPKDDQWNGVRWTAGDTVVLNVATIINNLPLPIQWGARAQRVSITPSLVEAEFVPTHEGTTASA